MGIIIDGLVNGPLASRGIGGSRLTAIVKTINNNIIQIHTALTHNTIHRREIIASLSLFENVRTALLTPLHHLQNFFNTIGINENVRIATSDTRILNDSTLAGKITLTDTFDNTLDGWVYREEAIGTKTGRGSPRVLHSSDHGGSLFLQTGRLSAQNFRGGVVKSFQKGNAGTWSNIELQFKSYDSDSSTRNQLFMRIYDSTNDSTDDSTDDSTNNNRLLLTVTLHNGTQPQSDWISKNTQLGVITANEIDVYIFYKDVTSDERDFYLDNIAITKINATSIQTRLVDSVTHVIIDSVGILFTLSELRVQARQIISNIHNNTELFFRTITFKNIYSPQIFFSQSLQKIQGNLKNIHFNISRTNILSQIVSLAHSVTFNIPLLFDLQKITKNTKTLLQNITTSTTIRKIYSSYSIIRDQIIEYTAISTRTLNITALQEAEIENITVSDRMTGFSSKFRIISARFNILSQLLKISRNKKIIVFNLSNLSTVRSKIKHIVSLPLFVQTLDFSQSVILNLQRVNFSNVRIRDVSISEYSTDIRNIVYHFFTNESVTTRAIHVIILSANMQINSVFSKLLKISLSLPATIQVSDMVIKTSAKYKTIINNIGDITETITIIKSLARSIMYRIDIATIPNRIISITLRLQNKIKVKTIILEKLRVVTGNIVTVIVPLQIPDILRTTNFSKIIKLYEQNIIDVKMDRILHISFSFKQKVSNVSNVINQSHILRKIENSIGGVVTKLSFNLVFFKFISTTIENKIKSLFYHITYDSQIIVNKTRERTFGFVDRVIRPRKK